MLTKYSKGSFIMLHEVAKTNLPYYVRVFIESLQKHNKYFALYYTLFYVDFF